MINEEKRIAAMKEYFTSDELSMIYWSLQLLGQHYEDKATCNWSYGNMADLCDLAGIWEDWLNSTKQNEREVALRAAAILGVEIRHYIPA